jgi:hypothetical protein
MGRKDGHQWGEKVAADGEKPMAIDRRAADLGMDERFRSVAAQMRAATGRFQMVRASVWPPVVPAAITGWCPARPTILTPRDLLAALWGPAGHDC